VAALVAKVANPRVKFVPGRYTAETFEVKVEDDYVVLEV
jgi:hypothetical protein